MDIVLFYRIKLCIDYGIANFREKMMVMNIAIRLMGKTIQTLMVMTLLMYVISAPILTAMAMVIRDLQLGNVI